MLQSTFNHTMSSIVPSIPSSHPSSQPLGLRLRPLPPNFSLREASLIFALVFDEINRVSISDYCITVSFKSSNACVATARLLDGKPIFGPDFPPVSIDYTYCPSPDQPHLSFSMIHSLIADNLPHPILHHRASQPILHSRASQPILHGSHTPIHNGQISPPRLPHPLIMHPHALSQPQLLAQQPQPQPQPLSSSLHQSLHQHQHQQPPPSLDRSRFVFTDPFAIDPNQLHPTHNPIDALSLNQLQKQSHNLNLTQTQNQNHNHNQTPNQTQNSHQNQNQNLTATLTGSLNPKPNSDPNVSLDPTTKSESNPNNPNTNQPIDLKELTGKSILLMESRNDAREYESLVRDPWQSSVQIQAQQVVVPAKSQPQPQGPTSSGQGLPLPAHHTSMSQINMAIPTQGLPLNAHHTPLSQMSISSFDWSRATSALSQSAGPNHSSSTTPTTANLVISAKNLVLPSPSNTTQTQPQHPSLGRRISSAFFSSQIGLPPPKDDPQEMGADFLLLARVPPPANPADQNPPCNTLYVGNLPPDATEAELRQLFAPQRGYRRLSFRTKNASLLGSLLAPPTSHAHGPMCFVEFEDVAHATRALAELYGRSLPRANGGNGKGGIRLLFSKNPLGVRGPGQTRRPVSGTTPMTSSSLQGPGSGSASPSHAHSHSINTGSGNNSTASHANNHNNSISVGNYGYLGYQHK